MTGSPQPIPGKCGRKLRGTNPPRYCKQPPIRGRTACKLHGGRTPRGPASPHYRDGKRSKLFRIFNVELKPGTTFVDGAIQEYSQREHRSLRREIAITAGLVSVATERVAEGGAGPEEWQAAQKATVALREALTAGSVAKAKAAVVELDRIVSSGAVSARAEAELRESTEALRKLKDTEAKLAERRRGMVTLEEFLTLARAMLDIAARFIVETKARAEFVREIEALVVRGQVVNASLPKGEEP